MEEKYLLFFKRRLITTVLFAGLVFLSEAQSESKIDSLMHELQLVRHDTIKVNILNEISELLWRDYKYADAAKYSDSAMSISERIHFDKGIATALFNTGNVLLGKAEYDLAINACQKAIRIFRVIKNKPGLGRSLNTLGIIFKKKGNYEEALNYYFQSLSIKEEIGDKLGLSLSYNNIANIYADLGKGNEALDYYLKSLVLKQEINDKRGSSLTLNNIGIIYMDMGKLTEAVDYFLSSLKIAEEAGDKRTIGMVYNNLGSIASQQNNNTEALKYYQLSLKIKEEISDKVGMALSYNNIGAIYLEEGNYSEALKNLLQAFRVFEIIGNKQQLILPALNIGSSYHQLGNLPEALNYYTIGLKLSEELDNTNTLANSHIGMAKVLQDMDNYNEAKKHYTEALSSLSYIREKAAIMNVYQELSILNCSSGDYHQALEDYKTYSVYKDSLLNETNSKLLAEMKTKYETEKKDVEINTLKNDQKLSMLELKMRDESLRRIKTEKEMIEIQNLLNAKQINLMANEQELQRSALEQKEANFLMQKAETEKQQKEVQLLSKESELQKLELKKQRLTKNYLMGGLGLMTLLSFLAYNNYLTRQQLKLQRLRNKIASDLHDDVGSTLSSIAIFSDIAQNQSKDVGPLLQTINESSRKMLDAMGDIVWTINPENDQFEKIILRMKSFAFDLLGAKNINFHFVADDAVSQIKLPMEVRKNIYLIFKEATNNMVKYSEADKAYFSIKEENKYLSMTINDNGKGFDPRTQMMGNGLKNMQKRADEIGAKLLVLSEPGKGTNIQLKIAV
jgi:two-component system, NarL family, sensor histidine kinase UhpB